MPNGYKTSLAYMPGGTSGKRGNMAGKEAPLMLGAMGPPKLFSAAPDGVGRGGIIPGAGS